MPWKIKSISPALIPDLSKSSFYPVFVLQLLCLATGVFAIAGAAITARDALTEASLGAPTEAVPSSLGAGTAAKLMMKLKTAQDLFICIIVWALLAAMVGLAALHAHSSPSTKYEVNLGTPRTHQSHPGGERREEKL